MKKLLAIIFLTVFWNGNVNAKAFKLVCTDSIDTTVPLSIQIMTGDINMGSIGSLITELKVSEAQYILTHEEAGNSWWVGINRIDGAFNATLKFSDGETIRWKGYCKKNVPKF